MYVLGGHIWTCCIGIRDSLFRFSCDVCNAQIKSSSADAMKALPFEGTQKAQLSLLFYNDLNYSDIFMSRERTTVPHESKFTPISLALLLKYLRLLSFFILPFSSPPVTPAPFLPYFLTPLGFLG